MIQPGFMVLQSNRLENLRQLVTTWLRDNPLGALEDDVLLVQSNGMAQWLKLALATDLGVASALDVMLPGRFQWRAYRAVLGNLPDTSPFDKALLQWRLLRLIPQLLDAEEFAPLRHFLRDDEGQRKHYQLAQRLADLLDQYQVYRADWLNDWSAGRDQITINNEIQPLPQDQRWQAALWRRLLADLADGDARNSRASIHEEFLYKAQQEKMPQPTHDNSASLPRRVVVFGLSSLPRQMLEVLAAIARHTQVILCVQNPSSLYWGDIVDPHTAHKLFFRQYQRHAGRPDLPSARPDSPATDLDTLFISGNPLLASWGRQGRDYLRLLDEHDQRSSYETIFQANNLSIDLFEAPSSDALLQRIQADVFHLRSAAEARDAASEATLTADQSVSFHIAHGAQRETEILQDYLLDLFNTRPDLKPRDVLVMVPDINQFAPHIQAVFGRISREDARFIPFTVSDQGKRQQAPLYGAFARLLELDNSNFKVSDLLDLIDVAAVQAAFGLSDTDRPLLHQWIEGAGVRWGLNAEHRRATGLPVDMEQNTWRFGLRRMLLGYAAGDSEAWLEIEPFPEVAGLNAGLAGQLAQLIQRLDEYQQLFRQPTDVQGWSERLHRLLRDFFAPQDTTDIVLLGRIEQDLESWQEACRQADYTDPLPLEIVREHLLAGLDETDDSQRFLAGSVNFATLMPMRAIPFKHICLLGLNDADYPRPVQYTDFDLMREDYRPGDRSRREDDRYLFLEALLSAREALYISWSGRDARDNSERPPSVMVAQLRDYIASTHGAATLDALTHEYPLQPFSQQYFDANNPDHLNVYTYAHEWQPRPEDHIITTHRGDNVALQTPPVVVLDDLSRFLRNPAEAYFLTRLGVSFDTENHLVEDEELFHLDGLSRWQLQRGILDDAAQRLLLEPDCTPQTALDEVLLRRQRQGSLGLGAFNMLQIRELGSSLIGPLTDYDDLQSSSRPEPDRHIQLELPDLPGQLDDVLRGFRRTVEDESVFRCVLLAGHIWSGTRAGGKGQIKWHYLAREWPAHLAAQLDGPVTTWLLGPQTCEALQPLSPEEARKQLRELLALWQQNLQQPLPAEVRTSCAWLTAADPERAMTDARRTYEGDQHVRGVRDNYALMRLWPDFSDLLTGGVSGDKNSGEAPGFQTCSTALYQPMVSHWDQRHAARPHNGDAL